eukprot:CAMPEP_0194076786 /NCGR_PEP_ID=MMETSP0149-20130528/3536_1 /TAXON_ID=122233 /ORGANISM="Chaetoceros debilis, Strain MM31A-1" /LENGTH=215 /DNA_ID=CAMNT_0038757643 /DNA_START=535 /DNA_END=1182 /DNA_ORIENTATION=+
MNQFVYLFVVISNFFLCANAFTNTDSLNIRRTSLLINRERYTTELLMSSDGTLSRKNFFEKTLSLSFFSAAASFEGSSPAHAKSKGEPVTKDSIKAAFQAVRDQLESPDGGVNRLRAMIEKEDFEEIMEFTKYYDLEFRKAKIVKARRLLTSKEVKERGLYLSNSVTFDLIGMNKGARPGQYDIEMVKKYFKELETDVANFLLLEDTIDFSVYDL